MGHPEIAVPRVPHVLPAKVRLVIAADIAVMLVIVPGAREMRVLVERVSSLRVATAEAVLSVPATVAGAATGRTVPVPKASDRVEMAISGLGAMVQAGPRATTDVGRRTGMADSAPVPMEIVRVAMATRGRVVKAITVRVVMAMDRLASSGTTDRVATVTSSRVARERAGRNAMATLAIVRREATVPVATVGIPRVVTISVRVAKVTSGRDAMVSVRVVRGTSALGEMVSARCEMASSGRAVRAMASGTLDRVATVTRRVTGAIVRVVRAMGSATAVIVPTAKALGSGTLVRVATVTLSASTVRVVTTVGGETPVGSATASNGSGHGREARREGIARHPRLNVAN